MEKKLQRLCVFCGSSLGGRPEYREMAGRLGEILAERGITLVYGGGNIGLMGVLADAVLEKGGRAIGVIPHGLAAREVAHSGLTELRVVDSMHERKAMMADLADGFIALPGGLGTVEEFCEILTWAQLGIHVKPCGLLNVAGYFDALVEFLDKAVRERFLRPEHRAMLLMESDPERLLARLGEYRAPTVEKWIDRDAT